MSTLTEGDGIIKQDNLGRVLATKEQRVAMMEEFERSGISGAAFARLVGVKHSTFAHWVNQWRKRKKNGGSRAMPVRWLEAEVEPETGEPPPERKPKASSPGLLVELSGGSRLWVESRCKCALPRN